MQRKWKERYPEKFRRRAVERMNACGNIVRLAVRMCRFSDLVLALRIAALSDAWIPG